MKIEFINHCVNEITKKYKISQEDAKGKIEHTLENNSELNETIINSSSLKEITKTRNYKIFIKKLKKEVYFNLRTYHKKNEAEPEMAHISTSERAPYLKELLAQIHPYLKEAKYILDIGGGNFPATFPFGDYKNLKSYVWIDNDPTAYKTLNEYKLQNNLNILSLYNESIGDKPWELYKLQNNHSFDFTFMLKLVPVVARQEKHLVQHLLNIPSRYILITGSKEAMVKKESIEHRERRVIETFLKATNRKIIKEVDTPNEFGYLLE